jgi:hypothetical protein
VVLFDNVAVAVDAQRVSLTREGLCVWRKRNVARIADATADRVTMARAAAIRTAATVATVAILWCVHCVSLQNRVPP